MFLEEIEKNCGVPGSYTTPKCPNCGAELVEYTNGFRKCPSCGRYG